LLRRVSQGNRRHRKKLSEAARLHACGQLLFEWSDEPAGAEVVNEALAAFGLCAEADLVIDEEFWLWPENVDTFMFWLSIQTQWNRSECQPCGLNYPAVQVAMEMRGVRKRDRAEMFLNVQAMEGACLSEWAKQR
jgi:hypothetical protein